MYQLVRPLLFSLSPEMSHDLTLECLSLGGKTNVIGALLPPRVSDPVEFFGCLFANRVGLAAGLDKNAHAAKGLADLGFGFVEVGTVTPLAQPGNPKPRMFRLPEHEAIINRMGFNNNGLAAMVPRIAKLKSKGFPVPLGVNLGKNKNTPAEQAVDDYTQGLEAVAPWADYVTINLSSPNTPGLRDLQFGEPLNTLLSQLTELRDRLADSLGRRTPLLVKLAPDMEREDLLAVADTLHDFAIDGIIATNTTVERASVAGNVHAKEAGGLSGSVLFDRSTEVVRILAEHLQGAMALVGVGGIHNAEQAAAKIAAGADLVQIYSGLIYHGPKLISASAQAIKDQQAKE